MAKRYYWLKLPENFFRQKEIKKLRKIAGGDTYTVIYLKMLLLAMSQDNKLYFDGVEDNFIAELALELEEEEENVQVTVQYLLRQCLMEIVDEDETEYLLTRCGDMTGSEGASAARVRKYRERNALQCNNDVTNSDECVTSVSQNGNGEIEKEREREKELEKELEKEIDSCADVEKSALEIFINLPLNDGKNWPVSFEYLEELKPLYPAVDVEQEIRKMRGWLDSNVRNRKTSRGIKRFITGWLAREQDKGRVVNRGSGPYPYYQQPQKQTVEQFQADLQRLGEEMNGEW